MHKKVKQKFCKKQKLCRKKIDAYFNSFKMIQEQLKILICIIFGFNVLFQSMISKIGSPIAKKISQFLTRQPFFKQFSLSLV